MLTGSEEFKPVQDPYYKRQWGTGHAVGTWGPYTFGVDGFVVDYIKIAHTGGSYTGCWCTTTLIHKDGTTEELSKKVTDAIYFTEERLANAKCLVFDYDVCRYNETADMSDLKVTIYGHEKAWKTLGEDGEVIIPTGIVSVQEYSHRQWETGTKTGSWGLYVIGTDGYTIDYIKLITNIYGSYTYCNTAVTTTLVNKDGTTEVLSDKSQDSIYFTDTQAENGKYLLFDYEATRYNDSAGSPEVKAIIYGHK